MMVPVGAARSDRRRRRSRAGRRNDGFHFAAFLVEFALDEGYTISFSTRTLWLELL